MKIKHRKKFLFELAKISSFDRKEIERFVFDEFPANPSLKYWSQITPLKSADNCYRIPFNEYRIALKLVGNTVIFERIRHRNDIYRLQT